jgi:hypothetical protein
VNHKELGDAISAIAVAGQLADDTICTVHGDELEFYPCCTTATRPRGIYSSLVVTTYKRMSYEGNGRSSISPAAVMVTRSGNNLGSGGGATQCYSSHYR